MRAKSAKIGSKQSVNSFADIECGKNSWITSKTLKNLKNQKVNKVPKNLKRLKMQKNSL